MKNKKALSEIISYVLLIVIALSLAAGVFSWVKFYVPQGEKEKCPEETALSISDYVCDNKTLSVTIVNKGYFNIDGFFIKAANESNKPAVRMLNSTEYLMTRAFGAGRYEFTLTGDSPLKNEQSKTLQFDYAPIDSIKRLQIQPYINANKTKGVLLCPYIEIPIDNCN